ncbi:MAG: hypothetical protein K9W43_04595 [Candidatus Thorarchaeota archaeon]|nr:hypothetical protein [Candidatus Thorarchaeota archaeon]
MGVRNFDFIPWIWSSASEIEGAIAVDMPNYLSRRMAVMRTHGGHQSERIPFAHVTVALSLIKATLSASLLPILIFDGSPEALKRPCNPELLHQARDLYDRFIRDEDPYDEEIAERLTRSPALLSYFAQSHVADIARALGVPTVVAPSEAEMYAAVLSRDSIVTTVVSNDVDALLFGAKHVTKQLILSRNELLRVTMDDVLRLTGLSLSQLRDLAIICGCDFHKEGLKGIGPRKGIALLLRHHDLEHVLKARGLSSSQIEPFIIARETFDEAEGIIVEEQMPRLSPPIASRVERFLRPIFGSQKAEQISEDARRRWKDFGIEQASLEMWF